MSQDPVKQLILVVDDDDSLRETIATVLGDDGYNVMTASNGAEAIAVLEHIKPRLMLLDLMMPVVSGWRVIEWMNESAERQVDYCVMTAVPNSAPPGERCVLEKPMRLDALLALVGRFCAG